MNDLIVQEKLADSQGLKALVLDSVLSPITRRVYNMALNEGSSRHLGPVSPRPP